MYGGMPGSLDNEVIPLFFFPSTKMKGGGGICQVFHYYVYISFLKAIFSAFRYKIRIFFMLGLLHYSK